MRSLHSIVFVPILVALVPPATFGQEATDASTGSVPKQEAEIEQSAPPFVLGKGPFRFANVGRTAPGAEEQKRGVYWEAVPPDGLRLSRVGRNPEKDPGIRLGRKEQAGAEIVVSEADTAALKGMAKGTLEFMTPDPDGVRRKHRPGVYQGVLDVKLDSKRTDGSIVRQPIKITFVVPGRTAVEARFVAESGGALSVGKPASVLVTVEDVHPSDVALPALDADQGELDLPWSSDDPASPRVLAHRRIPSKPEERARLSGPEDQWAWGLAEPVLPAQVISSKIDDATCPGQVLRTSEILVALPKLVRTGKIRGRVTWDDATLEMPEIPILPGLLTAVGCGIGGGFSLFLPPLSPPTPGLASMGERISVEVTGPNRFAETVELQREPAAGFARYYGEFKIPAPGDYGVVVSSGSRPEVVAAIREGTVVHAPLKASSELPIDEPLAIFTASPPLIPFFRSYASQALRHRDVLDLSLAGGTSMRLRLEGVFLKEGEDEAKYQRRISPQSDPSIVATDPAAVSSDEQAALVAVRQEADGWELNPGETRRLDLIAHIDPSTGVDPWNRPLKTSVYTLLWMIEGRDSTGRPIARLLPQDVEIRVASQSEWEFAWVWLLAPVGLVVLAASVSMLLVMSRGGRGGSRPSPLPSIEDELAARPLVEEDGRWEPSGSAPPAPADPAPTRAEAARPAVEETAFGSEMPED